MSPSPDAPTRSDLHVAAVDAWMGQVTKSRSKAGAGALLTCFEEAFAALWGRAQRTLGHVTLTAITKRVLLVAAEEQPLLSSIEVDASGLHCDELRARVDGLDPERLTKAIRHVLVEFLRVIGALTAQVLTAALHLELEKLAASANRRNPK